MAKSRCVLCGKELGFLNQSKIAFYWTEQSVCPSCGDDFKRSEGEGRKELEDRIMASPHLQYRERVDECIARAEERKKKEEAKIKAQIKHCPNCSALMELKLERLAIGADGYGGLSSFGLDQYVVDLFACPACGKVELYTAGFIPGAKEMEPETVTCPDCGTKHSPLINCPRCALNDPLKYMSSGGASPAGSKGSKPPWEK